MVECQSNVSTLFDYWSTASLSVLYQYGMALAFNDGLTTSSGRGLLKSTHEVPLQTLYSSVADMNRLRLSSVVKDLNRSLTAEERIQEINVSGREFCANLLGLKTRISLY